jgi:hypothetical protein
VLGFWSVASANLVSVTYTNDGTSAINCNNYGTWNFGGTTNFADVYTYGDQIAAGTMLGSIVTDSTSDPSLRFHNDIENGSGLIGRPIT